VALGVQDEVSHHRRRYRLPELQRIARDAGFEIERATYANITFLPAVFLVRTIMRLTRLKIDSEARINIPSSMDCFREFSEPRRRFLRFMNFPIGVSGLLSHAPVIIRPRKVKAPIDEANSARLFRLSLLRRRHHIDFNSRRRGKRNSQWRAAMRFLQSTFPIARGIPRFCGLLKSRIGQTSNGGKFRLVMARVFAR
jgi:hypothetical protein